VTRTLTERELNRALLARQLLLERAKTPEQVRANAAAADLPPLPEAATRRIAELYRERIAPQVHHRW